MLYSFPQFCDVADVVIVQRTIKTNLVINKKLRLQKVKHHFILFATLLEFNTQI